MHIKKRFLVNRLTLILLTLGGGNINVFLLYIQIITHENLFENVHLLLVKK